MWGMKNLAVIVSSTRPGRIGPSIARWAVDQAAPVLGGGGDVASAEWKAGVVDLAEVALPFLDEEEHPKSGVYRHEHTRRWKAIIDDADAVLVLTPEYNKGYPATIKNAIDVLYPEWQDKPVGLIGYGWGGAKAATDGLSGVLGHVKADVVGTVNLHFRRDLGTDGSVSLSEETEESFVALVQQLAAAAEERIPAAV